MGKILREIHNNPMVEIGKFYAYEYKGKFFVGEAVENPSERVSYEWAMKDLNTGKIHYPYSQQVFIPGESCSEVQLTYTTKHPRQ
jgi:hypothetical protein